MECEFFNMMESTLSLINLLQESTSLSPWTFSLIKIMQFIKTFVKLYLCNCLKLFLVNIGWCMGQERWKDKIEHLRFHLGDSTLCCTTMINRHFGWYGNWKVKKVGQWMRTELLEKNGIEEM